MKSEKSRSGYELVFTVTDYFGGPLKGIANYQGEPHFYERVFSEARDAFSESFRLTPVDAETFQLAMEAWNIWRRWKLAFDAGQTDISTHPALPHDANRHAELKCILDSKLVTDPLRSFTKAARFEVIGETSLLGSDLRPLQVEWAPSESQGASTPDKR